MLNYDIVWWVIIFFVGTGVILCAAVAAIVVYRGWAFLQVSVTSDRNSNETAAKHFVALLDEAKENMVVYDDGNEMEGSIYWNRDVVNAARQKLSNNPGFRLSCYFNFNAAMPFTRELQECRGFRVEFGQGDRPDDDVHYKIIDGGLKAHLSRHELASEDRRYRVIDCNSVPDRLKAHVTGILLRRCKEHAMDRGIWVTT